MNKEEKIAKWGKITKASAGNFYVMIEGEREIFVTIDRKLWKKKSTLFVGKMVKVEISVADLKKGKITCLDEEKN